MKKNIIAAAIMVAVSSGVYADDVKPYTVNVDGKTYQSNVVSLTDKGGIGSLNITCSGSTANSTVTCGNITINTDDDDDDNDGVTKEEFEEHQNQTVNRDNQLQQKIEDVHKEHVIWNNNQDKEIEQLKDKVANIQTVKGDKGDTGAQGAQGEQGVAGRDGKDGKDGKNGVNGKDGVAKVDTVTGVVTDNKGKQHDLASQVELDQFKSNQAAIDADQNDSLNRESDIRHQSDNAIIGSINAHAQAQAQVNSALNDKIDNTKVTSSEGTDGGVKLTDNGGNSIIADNLAQIDDVKKTEQSAKDHTDAVVKAQANAQAKVDADQNSALNDESTARHESDAKIIDSINAHVQAQAQVNNALVESVNTERNDRQSADEDLQSQIDINKAESKAHTDKGDAVLEAKKADKVTLDKETAIRKDEDAKLNARVDNETSARKDADVKLNARVDSEVADRVSGDAKLEAKKADKAQLEAEVAARAAYDRELDKRIAEKAAQQSKVNNYFDTKLNNHETRIGNIEQQVNTLKQDIDSVKGGVAQAMAASALVQPRNAGDNVLSAGIGGYDNKQAVAIGYTRNFNDNVAGKIVVSTDTESVSYGASVGFSW